MIIMCLHSSSLAESSLHQELLRSVHVTTSHTLIGSNSVIEFRKSQNDQETLQQLVGMLSCRNPDTLASFKTSDCLTTASFHRSTVTDRVQNTPHRVHSVFDGDKFQTIITALSTCDVTVDCQ